METAFAPHPEFQSALSELAGITGRTIPLEESPWDTLDDGPLAIHRIMFFTESLCDVHPDAVHYFSRTPNSPVAGRVRRVNFADCDPAYQLQKKEWLYSTHGHLVGFQMACMGARVFDLLEDGLGYRVDHDRGTVELLPDTTERILWGNRALLRRLDRATGLDPADLITIKLESGEWINGHGEVILQGAPIPDELD